MKASTVTMILTVALLMPGLTNAEPNAMAYELSYQLEADGNITSAVTVLQTVSGKERDYFFQIRIGWLYHLAGNAPKSIEAYNRAASLAPQAVEPQLGMMLPQMALRRWKDAETTARKVLRMEPKSFLGRTRLAWILFNLGRYAEAERVYRVVLESYPANLEMRAGLGWSLLRQGKKADAKESFAAVLKVSPKNDSASKGLQDAKKMEVAKRP